MQFWFFFTIWANKKAFMVINEQSVWYQSTWTEGYNSCFPSERFFHLMPWQLKSQQTFHWKYVTVEPRHPIGEVAVELSQLKINYFTMFLLFSLSNFFSFQPVSVDCELLPTRWPCLIQSCSFLSSSVLNSEFCCFGSCQVSSREL